MTPGKTPGKTPGEARTAAALAEAGIDHTIVRHGPVDPAISR